MSKPLTFLCVSCYFKGGEFLRSCKNQGNTVYLLTHNKLEHKSWPREAVDEFFYMDDVSNTPENIGNLINGVAWLMRSRKIDVIVALDDFDVEKVAAMREEFRIPGMGQTTARYFRDKLAMRMQAHEAGIPVPAFTGLFSDSDINEFTDRVPAPWFLKPRSEASAAGIKKMENKDQLWAKLHDLGDERHRFLLEQFCPGDVYHVDSLSFDGKVQFAQASKYLTTPYEVAHGAGVFRSMTCDPKSDESKKLHKANQDVMTAFGMRHSASHTEFIHNKDDGKFYFLETSCRVGGANLAEMVEAASGINLWAEWAKIETAAKNKEKYKVKAKKQLTAGILVSLARMQHPDQSVFSAEEVVWKMQKDHHVGCILQSENRDRVRELLDEYAEVVFRDFHASAPMPDKPVD